MAPERPGPEDERCNAVLLHANGATVPVVRHPAVALSYDLLKEGDGAAKVFTEVRVDSATTEDDDLTPLSWLQDRNLLKGIPLRTAPVCTEACKNKEVQARGPQDEVGQRTGSPTSDYADDSSEHADSSSCSGPSTSPAPSSVSTNQLVQSAAAVYSPAGQSTHPNIIPYNPKVHVSSKPPYSFSCLIFMAIEDCETRALPVKDIYAWILDHFPYFQSAPTGWKNSVRHNLSLNKCFKKVDKSPNVGKGSLWMVDPMYRPNLLQALRKAPYHPYMQLERFSANSALPAISSPSVTSASNSSNSSEYSMPVILSSPHSRPSNLPNPTLFPFLSRRLAAAGLGMQQSNVAPPSHQPRERGRHHQQEDEDDEEDSRDDVDAATAMLALKHGPRILLPRRDEWYKRLRDEGSGPIPALDLVSRSGRPRHHSSIPGHQGMGKPLIPVITSSPSEDHTYSAGPNIASPATAGSRSALSPDEAFGEGSASSPDSSVQEKNSIEEAESEAEEQRKIAEGADALLNLAGICTGRGLKRSNSYSSSSTPMRPITKRQRTLEHPTTNKPHHSSKSSRGWKKASLHQASVRKAKSKDKPGRHRR